MFFLGKRDWARPHNQVVIYGQKSALCQGASLRVPLFQRPLQVSHTDVMNP